MSITPANGFFVSVTKVFPPRPVRDVGGGGSWRSELVFLNIYGAQEPIPRNEFR